MNLIFDIGNTFTKIGVFNPNSDLISVSKIKSSEKTVISKILKILSKKPEIQKTILSSVSKSSDFVIDFLEKRQISFLNFNSKTPIPIKNLYKTPKTLGSDRLAAVIGANYLFPDSNVLVFDAGSALTVDFINSSKEYSGGIISPGLAMRFKALNHFTDKLPLIEADNEFNLFFGLSTEEAIKAGVQNSILFEIERYINVFKNKYPDLKIIFTGGDIFFFENKLKNNIFAQPDLVLIGLNRILEYNV